MKTKTSAIAGLILALLFGTALTLPINVAAEIQPVDKAPAETTTLPYFEVDTNKKGTLFDIDNNKGVDKAAPQTPKPPQRKGKKHRNKTVGALDQKSALDQKTTETTAQSRFSVGFDAVTPTPPTTDPAPVPSQRKGKKHRNKNSELATDKTNAAPINHDNVLWGDYFQDPPNPPPKSTKPNQFSVGSENEEQKGKKNLNNKNSEGSGTFYNRYQENDGHKKKHQRKPQQASPTDKQDQPKQKKKHHHHNDDQGQGSD